ncbi:Bug family tripartite tricarboxylate transporter substrate binding protein [Xenophilus azovorans]|uniref:Bug family tripartite tricarboxylate transporter substrate binding protein n=1 Tax=Xenophilus azovorans TaxID=151755 RepID=UPI0005702F84|nr:tripartite tricarboxylate transporter substrate binding protein [Xenophilus azovorans]
MPTKLTRRQALALALGACSAPLPAFAAGYPDKPIRMMVAFPAGGGPDLLARTLAEALRTTKGWNVVIMNKPGAGGNLGTGEVANAAPDGYTVLFGHVGALAVNPTLFKQLPFDPLKDFAPVGMIATSPLVAVTGAGKPYQSLRDVLAEAKKRPGEISVGFSGSGTISHLSMTQLASLAGVKLSFVPYKGASQGIVDVVAGNVDVYVSSMGSLVQHVRGGKARALAITSAARSPELPEVATVAEQGFPGFEAATWFGMVAPKGTPAAVVAELNAALQAALNSPAVAEKYRTDGSVPVASTPDEFGRLLRSETTRWGKVVRDAGVELQ